MKAFKNFSFGWTGFLLLSLFFYSFLLKVYPIDSAFWWAGDQIRDWTVAQRGLFRLPSHGTVRVDGYYSIGPVFFWVLCLINDLIGPFFDHLPHAGGYGIAFILASSEVFLAYALIQASYPRLLVIGLCFLFASAPYPSALAGTIWNPPVSIAFVHFALASVFLARGNFSIKRFILITVLGIFAIQAHTPTLFLISGIWVYAALQVKKSSDMPWLKIIGTFAVTICIVELPFLNFVFKHSSRDWATGPSVVGKAMEGLSKLELGSFLSKSDELLHSLHSMFMMEFPYFLLVGILLLSFVMMCVLKQYRGKLFFLSFVPLLLACLGLVLSGIPLDQYHFISLGLSVLIASLLLFDFFFSRFSPPVVNGVGVLSILCVLSFQSERWNLRMHDTVMPAYEVMVKGARLLKAQYPVLSKVVNPPMKEHSSAEYLYVLLGGKIDPKATQVGHIALDASVSVENIKTE